jgi:hypothetical protein
MDIGYVIIASMELTDAEFKALEDRLRPLLTEEFLSTLVEAVRTVGNSGDSVAQADFAASLFTIAGRPVPDLNAYDSDVEDARKALAQVN